MSEKPIEGYKRLWAFFYFIMALFGNLMFIGFAIIPKAVDGTIVVGDYTNWLVFNFMLLIITLIVMLFKFLLMVYAKVEEKID